MRGFVDRMGDKGIPKRLMLENVVRATTTRPGKNGSKWVAP